MEVDYHNYTPILDQAFQITSIMISYLQRNFPRKPDGPKLKVSLVLFSRNLIDYETIIKYNQNTILTKTPFFVNRSDRLAVLMEYVRRGP